jgi:hypothetical protein
MAPWKRRAVVISCALILVAPSHASAQVVEAFEDLAL